MLSTAEKDSISHVKAVLDEQRASLANDEDSTGTVSATWDALDGLINRHLIPIVERDDAAAAALDAEAS